MKGLIFILYLCVAITLGFMNDITEKLADSLSMSKTDVESCFNKTHVNLEDLMKMDELMNENIETSVINNSALKMIGTYIDIEKMKKEFDKKMNLSAEDIAIRNRILSICINQVKNTTNECKLILKLSLCVVAEIKHYKKNI